MLLSARGQVISRPASTWKCRWCTLWPARSSPGGNRLGCPVYFICSGGVNPPGIKVLVLRPKTLGAARRPLARRPGHIPARQHVEVQMVHALAGPLFPRRKPPGVPRLFYLLGRSESARHQGFGPAAQNAWRGSQALSPEARSCPGPPARGNADGARSGRPARRSWTPRGNR